MQTSGRRRSRSGRVRGGLSGDKAISLTARWGAGWSGHWHNEQVLLFCVC